MIFITPSKNIKINQLQLGIHRVFGVGNVPLTTIEGEVEKGDKTGPMFKIYLNMLSQCGRRKEGVPLARKT